MKDNTKDQSVKKSQFKDSKVDIKTVFSEKTDLDSGSDEISTFSNFLFIKNPQLYFQYSKLILRRKSNGRNC